MTESVKTSTAAAVRALNLRIDAATAEVLRAFDRAQVRSLLLKGASVAQWLYGAENPRSYLDCDLLVPESDLALAKELLSGLGFRPRVDEGGMPNWWREHSVAWIRREDGVLVDLHRTIPGVGVDSERLWLTLRPHVEKIEVAGLPVPTLSIPGRALQLALHAAHHGIEYGLPVDELERAIARVDDATWRAAAELAASVEATPAFVAGLRLPASGRILASRLQLPTDSSVEVALRASSPPPVALGLHQLARAGGQRARLQILARKLVPPAAFMRVWSPRARRGRLGLALAYAWRPLWLVLRAPQGFRAWRAARRRMGH